MSDRTDIANGGGEKKMRLIDADEIKKREHDVVLANGAKHRCFDTTMLYEIPTVDAVEVVRCKDCVHYNGLRCYKIKGLDALRNLGDFCSRGERREDGYNN